MRRYVSCIVLFAMMCVATSQAMTILIDQANQTSGGEAIITWFQETFPDATVTVGDYTNPTGNEARRTAIEAADILVISRRTSSWAYNTANAVYYSNLPTPVIFLTSYITRSSIMAFEGGMNAGAGVDGTETTVTEAGAVFFGVPAGTYDWYAVGVDTLGTGSVGTGKVLARIAGNNLAVVWEVGDTDSSGRVQAGRRLLYNIDARDGGTRAVLPDTAAGLQAFTAVVKAIAAPDTPDKPHEPAVLPENEDGSSGILLENNEDVAVIFSFKAAMDADQVYPVNPDIVGHYIYLTNGTSDPNLYPLDYVAHSDMNDPDVSYGPVTLINAQGKTFNWRVEEALDDGQGNPFLPGDPNNIIGNIWTFNAVGAQPDILSGPVHTLTDANGNAALSITTSAVANQFRWFKVVGQQDTAENEETDDILLTDAGIYSGTTTKTLTITGAASDGSDDAQYYVIAYNGNPETPNIPSVTSGTAWVWYPRLVSNYTFDSTYVGDDDVVFTPDVVSGYDAALRSNDAGTDIPTLAAGMPDLTASASSLFLNNPRLGDPNEAEAQFAQVDNSWAGAYKDITISVWVYWMDEFATTSNWQRIVDFGNDTDHYFFLTPRSGDGQWRFAVKNVTEQSVTAPTALARNQWSHVAVTLKDDTARMYLNGALVQTGTITHNPVDFAPMVNNYIGRSQWPDPYFNGMLDDLKIYNYARTTEQVAKDYLAVRGDWICNNELYDLPYDFNGDCIVNLADFAIFAETWLDSYRIYAD